MSTSLRVAQPSVSRSIPALRDYAVMGKQPSEVTLLLTALLLPLRSLPLPLPPVWELQGTSRARGET